MPKKASDDLTDEGDEKQETDKGLIDPCPEARRLPTRSREGRAYASGIRARASPNTPRRVLVSRLL